MLSLGPVRIVVALRGTVKHEYKEGSDPLPALGCLNVEIQRQFILYAGLPYVEIREILHPLDPDGLDPNFVMGDNVSFRGGRDRAWWPDRLDEELHVPTRDNPRSVFTLTLEDQVRRVPDEAYGTLPGNAGEGWFAFARGATPNGSSAQTVIHFFDGDHAYAAGLMSLYGNVGELNPPEGVPVEEWRARFMKDLRGDKRNYMGITAYIKHEARGETPLVLRKGFYLMDGKRSAHETRSVYMQLRSHALERTVRILPLRPG